MPFPGPPDLRRAWRRFPAVLCQPLGRGDHDLPEPGRAIAEEEADRIYQSEMATCLAHARWVAKGLYGRAVEAPGHVGITDVITLMGFYVSVAMTLAFYDVPAGATGMGR